MAKVNIEQLSRNATALLKQSPNPLDASFLLLGLLALRIGPRILGEDDWPAEAEWSTIEERHDLDAVKVAVRALRRSEHFHHIGDTLSKLGLGEEPIQRLLQRGTRGDAASLGDYIDFLSMVDVDEMSAKDTSVFTDEILDFGVRASGRSGAHYTPDSLAALIAEILDPPPGCSVYDPTTGSGGILVSMFNKAKRNGSGSGQAVQLYGQEVAASVAALASLNARFHGADADIAIGDTLFEPHHTKNGGLQTFDFVVANPPIRQTLGKKRLAKLADADSVGRFVYGRPGKTLDTSFLQHALAALNDHGRAAIVIAPGLLRASGNEKTVMDGFLRDDLIEAIVQLPKELLPYTSSSVALLVLNRQKSKDRKDTVLLVDASLCLDGEPPERRIHKADRRMIAQIVNAGSEKSGFSVSVSVDALVDRGSLVPSRYVFLARREQCLAGHAEWVPLREIADVDRGRGVPNKEADGKPGITPREMSHLPDMLEELAGSLTSRGKRTVRAAEGDILLRLIGDEPRAVEVSSGLNGALISKHIARIRFHEGWKSSRSFICDFLNSDTGQQLLSTMTAGSTIKEVRINELRDMHVPLPTESVQTIAQRLRSVECTLEEERSRVHSMRSTLFDLDPNSDVGKMTRSLSVEAQMLNDGLKRTGDLDYRIQTAYPFPLAFGYRSLASVHSPDMKLKALLNVVESAVSFVAAIGLSLAVDDQEIPKSGHAQFSPEALNEAWDRGISLGTWATLAKASAKLFEKASSSKLAVDYAALRTEKRDGVTIFELIRQLVETRNAIAHGRGPRTRLEYTEQTELLTKQTRSMFERLSFLVGYPLYYVHKLDKPWRSDRYIVEALVYTGDHPGMRRTKRDLPNPVSCNVLYIETDDDKWVPLYPFVSIHDCPECKHRETYVLDTWREGKRPELKSFERGHKIDQPELLETIGADLQELLSPKDSV